MFPAELQLSKTFYLISGILNLISTIVWASYIIIVGISTCGIACLFGFLPVINLISCIMDFWAFQKLKNLNMTKTYSTMQLAAILEIATILTANIVSFVFGILNLSHIKKENVQAYLKQTGIY